MNILVLSLYKMFVKTDKTEYSSKLKELLSAKGNIVDVCDIYENSLLLEYKLRQCVKNKDKPDFIVIVNALDGEDCEKEFRSKFAFIINRGERKVQEIPSAKEKINFKAALKTCISTLKNIPEVIKNLKNHTTLNQENNSSDIKVEKEEKTITYNKKKTHIFTLETGEKKAYTFSYCGVNVLALPKGTDDSNVLPLIDRAKKVFLKNYEEFPEGYSLIPKTVKVLTFSQRHLPQKEDSSQEKIRKSIMLAACCAFVAAGCMFIYNMFIMPMQNDALQSEIRTIFYEGETVDSSGTKVNKTPNWDKLNKINSDIKGWIKINNTKIDYPIVQSKSDNENSQFYLNHNYKKDPSSYGGIFIDYRSKKGMNSKNIIIHGHHMDDGSMFANLVKYGKYSGDLAFYKKSPTVTISTKKGGTETYKIFSVFKSNVNPSQGEYFDFYCNKFKSDAQFMNYVYNIRVRSLINCPVNINEDDQILTLVTCSYEFNDFRTIVVARKCRDSESSKVDTGSASLNKSPVWPQCYYSRYGGTRPTVSTFKTEYKKNKITWYDGDFKLKGSQQLPTSIKESTEPTTQPATSEPTATEKKIYTVKIYNRGKLIKAEKVKEGGKVKLPKIKKTYKKGGYKYTFVKWNHSKSKSIKNVRSNMKITAKYKKTKIASKKPAVKPTKPVPKTTPKPTADNKAPDQSAAATINSTEAGE